MLRKLIMNLSFLQKPCLSFSTFCLFGGWEFSNHQVLGSFCLTVLPMINLSLAFYYKRQEKPDGTFNTAWKPPELDHAAHQAHFLLSVLVKASVAKLSATTQRGSSFLQFPIVTSSSLPLKDLFLIISNRNSFTTVYSQSEIPIFEENAYRSQSTYQNIK